MDGTTLTLSNAVTLYEEQSRVLKDVVKCIRHVLTSSIEDMNFSCCLPFFKQLKALQPFDLSPDLDVGETLTHIQSLFIASISAYGEEARRLVDVDTAKSSAVFIPTFIEV